MTQFNISWTPVTVDDSGIAIVVDTYRIFVDGSNVQNVPGTDTSAVVTINSAGFHNVSVLAIGPGPVFAEGLPSDPIVVQVASGVPAQVTGVAATEV